MTVNTAREYQAVVVDARGAFGLQKLAASSDDEAKAMLKQRSLCCVQLLASDAAKAPSIARRIWFRARQIDESAFAFDLSILLQAGVTLAEALRVLEGRQGAREFGAVYAQLNEQISGGRSLSAALAATGKFSNLLMATVSACEQTSDLPSGLGKFAAHQQDFKALRDKLVAAAVYPALLLAVGACIVMLLLGVVVPKFSQLLDHNTDSLPTLSRLLLEWGDFASRHPIAPMLLFCGFLLCVGLTAAAVADGKTRRRLLEQLPMARSIAREFQHLQFYRTTGLLTSRGLHLTRALALGGELLGPTDQARLQAAIAQMRAGTRVSAALAQSGVAEPIAQSMISVAERSGSLPEMLDRIAEYYEARLKKNIDIASRLIEPVLMIIIGLVIGGLVLLMYIPIFDLASQIT